MTDRSGTARSRSPSPPECAVRAKVHFAPTVSSRAPGTAALNEVIQAFDRSSPSPDSRPLVSSERSSAVQRREGP
eukprot:2561933-Pyramimonas_sp.AAC.1